MPRSEISQSNAFPGEIALPPGDTEHFGLEIHSALIVSGPETKDAKVSEACYKAWPGTNLSGKCQSCLIAGDGLGTLSGVTMEVTKIGERASLRIPVPYLSRDSEGSLLVG